jgi:hypothetical protein
MAVFGRSVFGTGIENLACLGYIRGRYDTHWKIRILTLNHLVLVRIQVRQLLDTLQNCGHFGRPSTDTWPLDTNPLREDVIHGAHGFLLHVGQCVGVFLQR